MKKEMGGKWAAFTSGLDMVAPLIANCNVPHVSDLPRYTPYLPPVSDTVTSTLASLDVFEKRDEERAQMRVRKGKH